MANKFNKIYENKPKVIPEEDRIPDFVRKSIRRDGVSFSRVPSIAQSYYNDLIGDRLKKDEIRPKSIWEVFDLLKAKLSDGYDRPYHLRSYISELENATKESISCVVHSPSQHGKTTSTLVSLIYFLLTENSGTFKGVYCTYNQTRADYILDEFCFLLETLGIKYYKKMGIVYVKALDSDGNARSNSVFFTSVGGALTGFSTNLIVIDDYIKSGEDANSASTKDKVYEWYKRVVLSRQAKQLSIVVIATRASNDDLSGRLVENLKYKYVRLPAICDSADDLNGRELGEALWPEQRPLEQLEKQKKEVGERIFELLWQGNTVSDSSRIFQAATTYNHLPIHDNLVILYGVDIAYTVHKRSDYSVAVRLIVDKSTGIGYVDDVIFEQVLYRDFLETLKHFVNQRPGMVYWDASLFEKKTVGVDLKNALGGRAVVNEAIKSKYQRASKHTSKDWNSGFIRVPAVQSEMMQKLIATIELFVGEDGRRDDGVDALVSAWNAVAHIKNTLVPSVHKTKGQREFEHKQKHKILSSTGYRSNNSF
jgi:hypothetical protein